MASEQTVRVWRPTIHGLHFIGLQQGKTIVGTQIMSEANTLDRTTALSLMTADGYRLLKEEKNNGKIQPGHFANLAMLSQDFSSVEPDAIKSITSTTTIVNRKIFWADSDYQAWAPAKLPVIPDWSPVNYYGGYRTK